MTVRPIESTLYFRTFGRSILLRKFLAKVRKNNFSVFVAHRSSEKRGTRDRQQRPEEPTDVSSWN
jgi:hypothetical protein